jgi:CelD/BcsL family acetyltransferase involved in cellulose biosynthesis
VTYSVQREDDFDFLSTEYADLHRRSGATPFQHPVWLTALYEELAPRRNARKHVVTVRHEDGRLALVLPLVHRRRGILRLLEFADLGVNDYAAPVLDPAAPDLAKDDGVARQVRRALGRFDLLRIERVPDTPDVLLSLIAGSSASRHLYDTHLMELAETVEEWRDGLDPAFVRHVERKYKRLRPKGERRLRLVGDAAEVDALMSRMQEFRAARFGERGGIDLVQDPDCFRFYCRVARDSVAAGPGRLAVLEVGDEPVAVAFDVIDHDRELFLLVGYDVGRLRNYSLGLLIVDELVRDAIGRGQAYFDLTVGDESYKADFGARPRPMFEVRVQRTPLGRGAVLGRTVHLRARRLAKKVVAAVEQRRKRGVSGRPGEEGRPAPVVQVTPPSAS